MRLMHIHETAGFFGGVEQILHDTAQGFASRGWQQGLLHSGPAAADFCAPFATHGTDPELLSRFQPDVILIHKPADANSIDEISKRWPSVRMLHDHDLVCLRRHKYTPFSNRTCTHPAGHHCYTSMCFVNRDRSDSPLPVRLETVAARKRDIQQHQHIRRFIVGSHWMQQSLIDNHIARERIQIVHPIPACLKSPVALPITPTGDILYVGQVIRGKGVDLLLRALALTPGEWHATIVGGGNHLDTCRTLAQRLGLSERVTFTGRVAHSELEEYYRRARFTVVPSRWPEPFGMVGIEAMARGRPVIGFAAGGISDWLSDGDNGILVAQANVAQLAHAMTRLLQETDTVTHMGQGAAASVAQRFSHERYLDQMQTTLETA